MLKRLTFKAERVTVTIDKVVPEEFNNDGIKSQKTRTVLSRRQDKAGRSQQNEFHDRCSKLLGTGRQYWSGKRVTLGTELVSFQGKIVESIRVKPHSRRRQRRKSHQRRMPLMMIQTSLKRGR